MPKLVVLNLHVVHHASTGWDTISCDAHCLDLDVEPAQRKSEWRYNLEVLPDGDLEANVRGVVGQALKHYERTIRRYEVNELR
jgi:hypothetical protein